MTRSHESSPPFLSPEGLNQSQMAFVQDIFTNGAVQFTDTKIHGHKYNPEAPLSPYYINLRLLPRNPYLMADAARLFSDLFSDMDMDKVDACMGIPDAGTPLATAFSLKTSIPQIILRKDAKTGYGIEGRFVTPVNPGERVLVIDDLVTGGGSMLETIKVVEEAGLKVTDALVLIDREQGGEKALADAGYKLHSSIKASQLFAYGRRIGRVSNDNYERALKYMAASQ